MKINKIKLTVFISVLVLMFILFIIFAFKAYDYQKKYNINKYNITEIYDKKNSSYKFIISNNKSKYPYIFENKYIRKKELIKDIKSFKNDNETCILPISEYIDFYPLCSKNNDVFTLNLSKVEDITFNFKKIKKLNKEYNDIKINKTNDLSFLIYNYKGFYLINNENQKNIELFKKDNYNISLVYQLDKYILIPNYNNNYYFDSLYLIDIINGKVKEIKDNELISFDSEFLGNYKNDIYIIDKKEKKEYKININKKNIEEVDYQMIINEKLVKTSYKEIINSLGNEYDKLYSYKIKDNKIYKIIDKIKIKLSDKKVDKIIKFDNDTVYYLSNDKLYMYNNNYGEVLLLSYFEWNFNNTNVIYIYNK